MRIERVAQAAGVSISTVSRVLNHPDAVSERTRTQVWAAIESTGYVPNRLAGGLATSRSRTIGLIIPHILSSAFADVVRGLADKLVAANFELLLGLSAYSAERELEHVKSFLSQRVAGLVMVGFSHAPLTRKLLKEARIPVVETSDLGTDTLDMVVGFSNRDAARRMTELIASCGYRKIAFVSLSTRDNDREVHRREGYLTAVTASGGSPVVFESANGVAAGAETFRRLRAQDPGIDAVFCSNDALAVGCLLEAMRQRIAVPETMGVAGFGDVEMAREFVPALTTVRVRRYDMGARAAELLLDRIAGRTVGRAVVDLGYELVPRSSTRKRPVDG
ncbi:MAG: LacI family DNA-binding transcriptional regulator [Burkholderiaceae bacterium]